MIFSIAEARLKIGISGNITRMTWGPPLHPTCDIILGSSLFGPEVHYQTIVLSVKNNYYSALLFLARLSHKPQINCMKINPIKVFNVY
jgi:hypothetical protein